MGGGAPSVDTSAQERSLALQEAQLQEERETAQKEKEQVAASVTEELLARRRGQSGRQSLIATSGRGVLSSEEAARVEAFESEREATREAQLAELPELESERATKRRSLLSAMTLSQPTIGQTVGGEDFKATGGSKLTQSDMSYLQQIQPKRRSGGGLLKSTKRIGASF